MKKVLRLLSMVLNALIGIAEDKPSKGYMTVYEARDKFEAGQISIREYNEAFEHKEEI